MDTLVRENQKQTGTNGLQQTEQFVAPVATVLENEDGYTLQVEMPGVNKEGLEMWIENNELTIIGRRSMPTVSGTLIHRESRRENFRRAFKLDPSIDAGRIGARIEPHAADLAARTGGTTAVSSGPLILTGRRPSLQASRHSVTFYLARSSNRN